MKLYTGNNKICDLQDSSVYIQIPFGRAPSEYLTSDVINNLDLDGVTEIGAHAFSSTNIESIHIPASVTKLGQASFYNCKNLTDIYFEGDPPQVYDVFYQIEPGLRIHYKADNEAWANYNKTSNYAGANEVVWEAY